MESSTPPLSSEESRNWLELPPDVTSMILLKLGATEILNNAQYVCTSWRKICNDPLMWRSIDMRNLWDLCDMDYDLVKMAQHAVDRSCGQLIDINIEYFGTDDLLKYITDRSTHLGRLRLVHCYYISEDGFSEAATKLPLLEDLELSHCNFSKEALEVVGRLCPLLKSLKLNGQGFRRPQECNEEALAIAGNMPELRRLQLVGNKLTNDGLQAILDGCPHLESLDLRRCFNVKLVGNLGKRCAEQIKDLRRPNDTIDDYEFTIDDYEFDAELHDSDDSSSYGDYAAWLVESDILSEESYDDFTDELYDYYALL